ncbi:uncharacterized protein LOC127251033 [Andrographis paniculata]|uniref:uncharacterized protein LOC127251033 n=1 Tax=Andrographis paniculata TaxID=175694 RepID=UPI0021E8C6FF|nr:uncharacterized protein LOC127251033 [Andrographis paniculata]
MGKNGIVVFVFIVILVSNTCSSASHLRKLITGAPNNASTNSSVPPTGSPTHQLKKAPQTTGEHEDARHGDSHKGHQTDNGTLPSDSKDAGQNSTTRKTSTGKSNADTLDRVKEKSLGNNISCEGSLTSCRRNEIIACVKAPKQSYSDLFLVVQNQGKSNLKVDVNLPNYSKNPWQTFEVHKQNATTVNISSIVGKSATLFVNFAEAKCELSLANTISLDNLMQQLTFYSKQVTPIYAVYGFFLLVLLFGGTWACCKFRKRHVVGVPYQELEMGLPEPSTSVTNVDAAEGWNHDWDDDDDWDEETAVKSPAVHHARNISVDGLISRPQKKDGWEWED